MTEMAIEKGQGPESEHGVSSMMIDEEGHTHEIDTDMTGIMTAHENMTDVTSAHIVTMAVIDHSHVTATIDAKHLMAMTTDSGPTVVTDREAVLMICIIRMTTGGTIRDIEMVVLMNQAVEIESNAPIMIDVTAEAMTPITDPTVGTVDLIKGCSLTHPCSWWMEQIIVRNVPLTDTYRMYVLFYSR